jgi:hypothetical protein
MHFSEDELRAALHRKNPGESFTDKVMAHIASPEARRIHAHRLPSRFAELWRRLALRPALAAALILVVAAGVSLGYLRYLQIQERRAGEIAKQQALLALRITNAKLNHVFERVKSTQAP